ncbi:MAG: hypothetical protein IJS90_07800 [Clostridia bacterium]|nr:hypothetical protein [Clostridia bacterium]
MKKKKDLRVYLFPWILFTVTSFIFYAAEAWLGYLYVLEQFFAIGKYFSYIYALILVTEFFAHSVEKEKNGQQTVKTAEKKKRSPRSGASRFHIGKKPRRTQASQPLTDAENTPLAEETKEAKRGGTASRLSRLQSLKLITVVHMCLLVFMLARFTLLQFQAFYIGTLASDGKYGVVFIGISVLAAAVYFIAGNWMKGLPEKPGSVTARGMILCCGTVYAVSALFFALNSILNISCLPVLVWVIKGISLAFVLLFLTGAAKGLIKKDLLKTFDYLFLLRFTKKDEKKSFADFLEENTGLSVKSLWSIRYAVSLLPTALLSLLAVLLLASCFYKVDLQQQAVVYRFGRILESSPVEAGLHVKLPWPVDKAEIYDTARVKEVLVGYEKQQSVDNLWTQAHGGEEYQLLLGNGNELVSVNVKIAYVIDDLCQYVTAYASPEDVLTAKAYEIILSRTVSTDLDTFLSEDRSGLSEEIAKELNDFCAASGIGLRVGSVTLESIHPPIDIADVYQGVVSAGIQKNTLITNARAEEAEKLAAAEQEAAELVLVAKKDQTQRVSEAEYEIDGFLAAAQAYKEHPDAVSLAKYLDTFETVVSGNKVYVFIGDLDPSDYLIDFSGNHNVVNSSDFVTSAKPENGGAQ